jgi:hypothetical protein
LTRPLTTLCRLIGTADIGYMLRDFDKELSKKVGELKYSPINVVYAVASNRKEFSYSRLRLSRAAQRTGTRFWVRYSRAMYFPAGRPKIHF